MARHPDAPDRPRTHSRRSVGGCRDLRFREDSGSRHLRATLSFARGIEWVVNGEVVIEGGRHTGARPGRVRWTWTPDRAAAGRRGTSHADRSDRRHDSEAADATPADGKTHLVRAQHHESGRSRRDPRPVAVTAGDGSGERVAAYEGQNLIDVVARPGAPAAARAGQAQHRRRSARHGVRLGHDS